MTLNEEMCIECLLCQDHGSRVSVFKELCVEREDFLSWLDYEQPKTMRGKAGKGLETVRSLEERGKR